MGSNRIKLLLCVFIFCYTVENNNGALVRRKRFINLLTDSVRIISSGLQQQSDILNQGIQDQIAIISQVPTLVHETSKAVENSVLRAAEGPSSVVANVILTGANVGIKATKKETIPLPEISTSVLGFGTFIANGGKLRNLATLTSNGPVKLQRSGHSLTIDFPFRLKELSVEYENYSFKTWGMNMKGAVKATIGNNAFLIKIQLLGSEDCTINLQRVEVQALEDVKVDLQGSYSSVLKSAANYIATFLQGMIKTEVQKALDQQLSKFFNSNSKLLCSRFTQFLL